MFKKFRWKSALGNFILKVPGDFKFIAPI